MTEKNDDKCPRCGGDLQYEEVDIGVGIQRGNPGCPDCHWVPGAGPMIESYRETAPLPAGPAAPQTPREEEDLAELAQHPVSYATVVDHYREMARRFAESRDELKHRCRALETRIAEVSRASSPSAALRALVEEMRVTTRGASGSISKTTCRYWTEKLAALLGSTESP